MESILIGDSSSGTTLRETIDRDFGLDAASTDDVDMTPEGAETKVLRKFAAAQQSDMGVVQIQLGDTGNVSSAWSIDQIEIKIEEEGEL